MSALGKASESRTRRRRVFAFAGMVTTVAGLVGLRTATAPPATQALGSSGVTTKVRAAGGSDGSGRSTASAGHHHGHHHAHHHIASRGGHHKSTTGGSSGQSSHRERVLVGKAYDVNYGIVQVKVKLKGTRIVDVIATSLPSGGHSSDVSNYAAPRLRQEALAAQSAHIDAVSGASYTSAGYAQSLQSALDQAHS